MKQRDDLWFTFILRWRGNRSITGGFFFRHKRERETLRHVWREEESQREFLKFLSRGKNEEEEGEIERAKKKEGHIDR